MKDECRHENTWFDRSLCATNNMHTICNDCGVIVGGCDCESDVDVVNHPPHYKGFSNGAEVIDITENLSFNAGNAVKYLARAGRKTENPIEDLRKAQWYVQREITRLTQGEIS